MKNLNEIVHKSPINQKAKQILQSSKPEKHTRFSIKNPQIILVESLSFSPKTYCTFTPIKPAIESWKK